MRLIAAALTVSILFYGPAAFADQPIAPPAASGGSDISKAATRLSEADRLDEIMREPIDSPTEAIEGFPAQPFGEVDLLLAQTAPSDSPGRTARDAELVEQIKALQAERSQVNTRGATAAIIGGAVATGVGFAATLLILGGCGFSCDSGVTEATAGSGGGLALAGLISIGAGLGLRQQKRDQVSEIENEIRKIQQEREEVSPRLGGHFRLGEEKLFVLSLRY